MSVWEKPLPLYNSGKRYSVALAYEKQSPELSFAECQKTAKLFGYS